MDEGCGQLVKMLLTIESYGIFRSNFAYLFILTLSSNWYANGDEALPSFILDGRGLLEKMLITLEQHHIF